MKILLIIPPSAFLIDERVIPPLGVLRVAATLEKHNTPVEVLDLSGAKDGENQILIRKTPHKTIGITATTAQIPAVTKLMPAIRKRYPQAKVILGGPHVTMTLAAEHTERGARAAERLKSTFDVLISGDGEKAILEAIKPNPPALLNADDKNSPLWMSNDDYEESPLPARHLIDLHSYKYKIDNHPTTSLIAQLGCPFHCGFCGGRSTSALRITRNRSADSVVAEIKWLYQTYGFTGFMFYDDELNVSPTLVELMNKLINLQVSLGVEFRLRGFIKSELFNEKQAAVMYKAGFRWLLCGFESADDRILLNMRKRATLADNTNMVTIAKKHGFKIKALMSIGHPGETKVSVWSIHHWLIDMKVDDFDCTIITPYPGSPYHDEAVHDGNGTWTYTQPKTRDKLYALETDFETQADYYKGMPGEYESMVWTDELGREDIVHLRDKVEATTRYKLGLETLGGCNAV